MCVADPAGTTCYFQAMAHVGGNIILARRKFVFDRGGEALWERVLRHLPDDDARQLRRTLLVTGTWPLALNLRLDERSRGSCSRQIRSAHSWRWAVRRQR